MSTEHDLRDAIDELAAEAFDADRARGLAGTAHRPRQ